MNLPFFTGNPGYFGKLPVDMTLLLLAWFGSGMIIISDNSSCPRSIRAAGSQISRSSILSSLLLHPVEKATFLVVDIISTLGARALLQIKDEIK